jgi:hypothetical protein
VSDLDYNDDGSVDFYLGPIAPEGKEKKRYIYRKT